MKQVIVRTKTSHRILLFDLAKDEYMIVYSAPGYDTAVHDVKPAFMAAFLFTLAAVAYDENRERDGDECWGYAMSIAQHIDPAKWPNAHHQRAHAAYCRMVARQDPII